jgi:hypothetical protein
MLSKLGGKMLGPTSKPLPHNRQRLLLRSLLNRLPMHNPQNKPLTHKPPSFISRILIVAALRNKDLVSWDGVLGEKSYLLWI